MYFFGRGVPKDYVSAHMWCTTYPPPPTGNEEVAKNLRDTMPRLMTPSQVAEAQKLAREWEADACFAIGPCWAGAEPEAPPWSLGAVYAASVILASSPFPRSRCSDDRKDGADLLGCHVAEIRRQHQRREERCGSGFVGHAQHSSTGWHHERKVSQPAWLAIPAACSWSSKCACESSRRTGSCNVRTLGT